MNSAELAPGSFLVRKIYRHWQGIYVFIRERDTSDPFPVNIELAVLKDHSLSSSLSYGLLEDPSSFPIYHQVYRITLLLPENGEISLHFSDDDLDYLDQVRINLQDFNYHIAEILSTLKTERSVFFYVFSSIDLTKLQAFWQERSVDVIVEDRHSFNGLQVLVTPSLT